MQDLHEGWAAEIDGLLKEKHRTRVWLATAVGVHPSTITRILAGELCPNDELKWKIAGALAVRMDILWAWPKIVPPAPSERIAS